MADLGFKPSLLPSFIQLHSNPTLEAISDLQRPMRGLGFSEQYDSASGREPLKVLEWASDIFYTVLRIFVRLGYDILAQVRERPGAKKHLQCYSDHLAPDGIYGNEATPLQGALIPTGLGSSLAQYGCQGSVQAISLVQGIFLYLLYF